MLLKLNSARLWSLVAVGLALSVSVSALTAQTPEPAPGFVVITSSAR